MRYLVDTELHIKWKKLTTWWPDCSHDINCHSSKNCHQGNGTNRSCNWRLTTQTSWIWLGHHMTNFQEIIRADCTISACRPLPLSIKALAHWLSVQEVSLLLSICPPPAPLLVASIQSKANFPFHQSHLSVGFWEVSGWTPQGDRPQRKPTLVGPWRWTSRL